MSANVLDPRMIDPTKPLSCFEIRTNALTALDTIISNKLITTDLTATNALNNTLASINLTSVNITATAAYINQATISAGTFTGPVVSNFLVTTTTLSSYIFTDADNSKVFHFNTTVTPSITATFLSGNISEGFNVGITNTGTGVIILSSNFSPVINAPNTFNSVQHSGMFIYLTNNQLYGVGVFE